MSFLPQDYSVPQGNGGQYFRPKEGSHRVRILKSPALGWVLWENNELKGRYKERVNNSRHFWAMAVYNYTTEGVQLWEVTQQGIQDELKMLADNPDWGSPLEYDITVVRKGSTKDDTSYSIQPSPNKGQLAPDAQQKVAEQPVNLEALFSGGDPFETHPL
ncbi:MAG: hypothetical protein ACRBG0_19255 [Lewinella sp.]|uniref:hypothetical protein n=1 Tax=Lewinella sp. TaxID=2004506 RepID=UPI003D6B9450